MHDYELVFIISPDVAEDDTAGVIDRVKQFVEKSAGEVTKAEPWGHRRLAYPIRDFREGTYVIMQLKMDPKTTAAFERNLRLTDNIIRHLLIRLGE